MAINDITLKDIFTGIDTDKLKSENPINVPDEFYKKLLDYVLERDYLNHAGEHQKFAKPDVSLHKNVTWLQVIRLPVHPDNIDNYDIFNRWQSALSTLHAWGYRVIFLLQRSGGETNLFIGTASNNDRLSSEDAIEQVREAINGNMPGICIEPLSKEAHISLLSNMDTLTEIGAVTGIPSFLETADTDDLQTLDRLAFGIRDSTEDEHDYSLMVIADPISDSEISGITSKMRKLGSEIHTKVSRNVSESETSGESKKQGAGTIIGGTAGLAVDFVGALLGCAFGIPVSRLGSILSVGGIISGIGANMDKTISNNFTRNISSEYLDKFAQYAEEVIDKHIERLKQGRNVGFWNTGIYVLAKSKTDVLTVEGMLRSVYSGDESYLEPIRIHYLKRDDTPDSANKCGAIRIVKNGYNIIPFVNVDDTDGKFDPESEWHVFGKYYQDLSTPLNTKELALSTSLPRHDVPGLRFVKTAVRFANNPADFSPEAVPITIGHVVDMGVKQNNEYKMDLNSLVRHALVTGSTGCGKTTTCKGILQEVLHNDVPVLVIEPAKDDYVRWAIKMNEVLPPEKQFTIYMPGVSVFDGHKLSTLALNPFQPGAVAGARIDMLTHSENITSILNASLPVSDVLPTIIDETVYHYLQTYYENKLEEESLPQFPFYPRLDGLIAAGRDVLSKRGYEQKVTDNLKACLETRFSYLTRGARGKLLNVDKSVDFDSLFGNNVIINLSRISGAKDKALIMSVLLLNLYEYRISKYGNDVEYRKNAQSNKLLHLTLIEEAHNVLMKPQQDMGSTGNPQQVVADLFSNILSEIRGYGEGFIIVDQIPTRLVPDVIKNTNYKIVHRMVSPDDCEIMSSCLALRDDQKSIIPSLPKGNAIVCGDLDDAASWVCLNKPADLFA